MAAKKVRFRACLFFGAAAALAVPGFAQTQTQAAIETSDTESPQSGGLEEITVTSRKVTENIVEAPITVTALTADSMENMGLENRDDLGHFAPGFSFPPGNGASTTRLIPSYQMRGLGTVNSFWNGVPLNGGDIPELLDLQRVEVLRGPQNAYFGRSTFSGAVNFISEQASFDTHAYADIDEANYGTSTYKAGVEGTVIPELVAVRVAGSYRDAGGQYLNYGYGSPELGAQRTTAGAVSVLITPMENLKVRIYGARWEDEDGPNAIAYYQQEDDNCNAGGAPAGQLNYICGGQSRPLPYRISQLVNFPPGAISAIEPLATQTTVGSGFITGNGLHREGEISQLFVDYQLPWNWTASLIGAYNKNRAGQIQDYGNRFYDNADEYNPSLTTYLLRDRYGEGRIQSNPDAPIRGLLGASYVYSTQGIQSVINKSGIASVSFPPNIFYSKTLGIFGSVAYDIIDKLTATVEGRWQEDEVGQDTIGVENLSGKTVSFVPRALLEYHFVKTAQVYASFSEGTRPGALNTGFDSLPAYAQAQVSAQFNIPSVVPEERLYNYEIGIKGDFLDATLRSMTAIYYARDRGRQEGAALFYTATNGALAQANVTTGTGAVNAAGLEEELQYVPDEHWALDGTFAYNWTHIVSDSCASCEILTGNIDPVGNHIAGYPIMTASLGAAYKWHAFKLKVGAPYDAYVRLDGIYQGKEYADETNLTWLDPYVIVNLRAGLDNGTWKFEVYGKNINDNKVPQSIAQTNDQTTGAEVISLAPANKPMFGARVMVKF